MKAVVLSGGGAKGAYEVGVWKALRELEYSYDIVTGTSIGSVNGLFMVQNDYYKCFLLWYYANYDMLYNEKIDDDLEDFEVYKQYVKNFIEKGGMSTSKMAKLLDKVVKFNKFKKSKVDYGIVTYNLTKMKPVIKTKKDFTETDLKNYVLASCTCYPAFQKLEIDGNHYIDGGYYDNMPINLAIDMGATEILAVDLNAIGIQRKPKDKKVKITYIKPRNDIGSFLVFSKENARRAMKLGYNDTMKTFGKLDGDKFTFKHKHLIYNYEYIKDNFIKTLNKITKNKKFIIVNRNLNYIKSLDTLPKKINEIIEYLGEVFDMDEADIHKIYKFNSHIKKELKTIETYSKDYIYRCLKETKLQKLVNSKMIIKYIYDLLEHNKITEVIAISNIFAREFNAALYLHSIKKSQLY